MISRTPRVICLSIVQNVSYAARMAHFNANARINRGIMIHTKINFKDNPKNISKIKRRIMIDQSPNFMIDKTSKYR